MNCRLVDTHCHLEDEAFRDDYDIVIKDALDHGICMITSGLGVDGGERALNIANKYDGVFVTIGLSPPDYPETDKTIELIRKYSSEIVAIGEVGLDFWYQREESDKTAQRNAFRKFIALAKELDLPLSIHSRSAGHYAIEVLAEEKAERVHMHAFDGRAKHALKGVELGYYFSIPPSIVRSAQKVKLAKVVPIEQMFLETDSPVLGPEPRVRNIPLNVEVSLEKIAEIKNLDVETVAEITTKNAKEFYNL